MRNFIPSTSFEYFLLTVNIANRTELKELDHLRLE